MSSASLAVASRAHIAPRQHLDPSRIAAISAALALNLAVILIASRPLMPTQLSPFHAISPTPTIQLLDPPAVVPPPPPIVDMLPLPHPVAALTALVKSTPISVPVVTPTTEGMIAAPPVTVPTIVPGTATPVTGATTEPVEASLAYRASPLRFPTRALQQRMSGTVMLRVLVDETGKPLQVTVEHGSGYALLDRSATEQVMAGWRFQPAMVNGQAVRAWARVPVTFELH
jgi:protein TonB